VAISRPIGLEQSIIEHVFHPQTFRPKVHRLPQGGTLVMQGRHGEKVLKKQSQLIYTENPQEFHKERVLMKVQGQDGRTQVHNTTEPPYCIHAQLTVKLQNETYGGSGTLVGPHHLLTCAHNIYKFKQRMWASEITVYPALNGKQVPFGQIKVTRVYTFTQYTQNKDSQYDLALLILEKSIGKYTGWAGLLSAPDRDLTNKEVQIHGYPGDKNFTEMWGMKHTIQQIQPEKFEYLIDTNGGQSGSAIWIDQFGIPLVIGVHTLGGQNSNFGVRISDDKFKVLVAKIEETYKREKIFQSSSLPQVTSSSHSSVIASRIQESTLPQIAFGKAKWAQYFGDVGVEPSLPPNIHDILNGPCPIWPGKKVHETHLLTLIPETLNGQPLTLKILGELVQKPLHGYPTEFRELNLNMYQDRPASASHWTLLSRDLIPDSRKKTYEEHKQFVEQYPGYEVPNVIDTAVAIFMEYVQSGIHLYGNEPLTFTRCQEQYSTWSKNSAQLVVGFFAAAGLTVYCDDIRSERIGVGAQRKL